MESLKIKVDGNLDEVVDLFKKYGCKNFSYTCPTRNYILLERGIIHFCKLKSNFKESRAREVNIDQLRDLVVLKRNSIEDATHEFQNKSKVYVSSDDICYSFSGGKWEMFTSGSSNVAIKPIGAVMKEFLVSHNNKWTLQLLDSGTEENSYRVAVPSGANMCIDKYFFYKDCNTALTDQGWMDCDKSCLKTVESMVKTGGRIIWQRHKQPEELPLADGEKSLNNQYAEIEKARQATKETEYLMQGKNGERLIESLAQFNNTDHGADFDNFELLEDSVNHPSHYSSGEIECIDAIQSSMTHEAFCGYLKGNVQKYMWRYENKGGTESLKKAQWYLNKLIEVRNETSSKD